MVKELDPVKSPQLPHQQSMEKVVQVEEAEVANDDRLGEEDVPYQWDSETKVGQLRQEEEVWTE